MKVTRLRSYEEVLSYLNAFAEGKRVGKRDFAMAVIDELTPKLVEALLDRATRNRKPDPRHVNVLASVMGAGGFVSALDPLRVNAKGQPIDFMHRGLAILASQVTLQNVPLFVLADARAMTALDTDQKARTLRNVYDIRGDKPIPNCVLSGMNLEINNFKTARVGTQLRDHLVHVYDKLDLMMELYKVNSKVTGGTLAAAARCAREHHTKALHFFKVVILPQTKYDALVPMHKSPEMIMLRKHLDMHVRDKVRGQQRLHLDAAKSIYAFERWYSGEGSTTMRCPVDGSGRYMILSIGEEDFFRSPMSRLLINERELRSRSEKVVRDWNKLMEAKAA